jgi:hypothetical protein
MSAQITHIIHGRRKKESCGRGRREPDIKGEEGRSRHK